MSWDPGDFPVLSSLRARARSLRTNNCCDGVFKRDASQDDVAVPEPCWGAAILCARGEEERAGAARGRPCGPVPGGGRGELWVCVTGGSSRSTSGSGGAGGAMPLVVVCGRPGSGKSRREPDPNCRWDRPLFTVRGDEPLPLGAIRAALFESAPPPPHRSTRTQPLQSCGFLHQLDRVTQDVLAAVLAAQRSGAQPGETIRVPGVAEGLVLSRPVSVAELSRLRRQFISYTKMQPSDENLPQLASMFLQYLSRSIQ
ncbi:protein KTI12 homolog [Parus major]|uniref:protein KTI12 homolog n=1 Tax=Parus major TaxID=9157 RepID=UPI0007715943|nr:protein KTI12 homolog [Parus major]